MISNQIEKKEFESWKSLANAKEFNVSMCCTVQLFTGALEKGVVDTEMQLVLRARKLKTCVSSRGQSFILQTYTKYPSNFATADVIEKTFINVFRILIWEQFQV